jgi:hypothetical protein
MFEVLRADTGDNMQPFEVGFSYFDLVFEMDIPGLRGYV